VQKNVKVICVWHWVTISGWTLSFTLYGTSIFGGCFEHIVDLVSTTSANSAQCSDQWHSSRHSYQVARTIVIHCCTARACLDQHLIVIRSLGICGDHVWSGTGLIAIIFQHWMPCCM